MISAQESCGKVADKYVEYEFTLIALDMLMLRVEAFRHILFNRRPSRHPDKDIVPSYKILVWLVSCPSHSSHHHRQPKYHPLPTTPILTVIFNYRSIDVTVVESLVTDIVTCGIERYRHFAGEGGGEGGRGG